MTSRPKHVSSLSDKIAGLKFMQRAKAVQDKQQQPGPSSVAPAKVEQDHSPADTSVENEENSEEGNDEHWVLPGNTNQSLKRKATSSSIISHEPGWNAWLTEAEDTQPTTSETVATGNTRRLFGTWVRRPRRKREKSTDDKTNGSVDVDEEESDVDASDEASEESDEIEEKSFMKPGSVTSKSNESDKSNKRSHSQATKDSRLGNASKEQGKRKKDGKEKKQRGGREPDTQLSGFPDQNKPHKKKKSKV